eukprot:scaffold194_cov84-Skeletonema_dohrnii-CCMP3373.AAC.2
MVTVVLLRSHERRWELTRLLCTRGISTKSSIMTALSKTTASVVHYSSSASHASLTMSIKT